MTFKEDFTALEISAALIGASVPVRGNYRDSYARVLAVSGAGATATLTVAPILLNGALAPEITVAPKRSKAATAREKRVYYLAKY